MKHLIRTLTLTIAAGICWNEHRKLRNEYYASFARVMGQGDPTNWTLVDCIRISDYRAGPWEPQRSSAARSPQVHC